ncbi:MAG TPA: ThuA domain-containing protein [Planctomycetota bacterium]|nr:ThuA domain-containing protein [Planctomycetota bacterium]
MLRLASALAASTLLCSFRAEDPVPLLIVTGSHRHDWVNTTPILKSLLEATGRFTVTVTEDPAKDLTPEALAKVRVVVLHYRENDKASKWEVLDDKGQKTGKIREVPPRPGRWPEAAEKALLGAVEKGLGCVALHYGTSAFDDGAANWPEYEKLIGGGWRVSKKAFGHSRKMFQFEVKIANKDHPITKGFPEKFLHAKDELYHKSLMVEGNTVLTTAFDDPKLGDELCTGKDENGTWVREHGKGRVFTTVLGHGPDQMRLSPGFRALFARGCEWAATGKVTIPVPAKLDAEPAK